MAQSLTAADAVAGREYRVWTEKTGIVQGQFFGRGRGQFRETFFFRGTSKKPVEKGEEKPTLVVGIHANDGIQFVAPREMGGF